MADLKKEQAWLITVSLVVVATVCMGFILNYAQSVLIPFVLAIFISLLVSPLVDLQVKKMKFPRPIAITSTLLVVVLVLIVAVSFISEAVQTIIMTTGQYKESLVNVVQQTSTSLSDWNVEIDQENLISTVQEQVPKVAKATFGGALNAFSTMFLIAIFVVFIMVGYNPHKPQSDDFQDIARQVRRYILTKTIISAITGFLVYIVLRWLGLELASVFGMLAFVLNFIPSIGSIIATLLPLPIALLQFDHPWMVVLAILIPGAIQMSVGNIIEPRIMGKGLHLHPVTILLALSFWGLLWGPIGMLLSVPITAIIRMILMRFDTLRPVGFVLAGQLSEAAAEAAKPSE